MIVLYCIVYVLSSQVIAHMIYQDVKGEWPGHSEKIMACVIAMMGGAVFGLFGPFGVAFVNWRCKIHSTW